MSRRIFPPLGGAANNSTAYDTPQPVCPPSSILNVVPYDSTKDRPRMGTRPVLFEFFPGQYGNGAAVQGMGRVMRGRTQNGYVLGSGQDRTPNAQDVTRTMAGVAGQVWALDIAWGLYRYAYEDVSVSGPVEFGPDTGPANQSVNAVAETHPQGSPTVKLAIVGSSYDDGSGFTVVRITARDLTTGAIVWTRKLSTASVNRYVNHILATQEWVFVCTNQYVHVLQTSDGADPAAGVATYDMNGWADEVVSCCLDTSGRLLVVFTGSSVGATLASGVVVTAGKYARDFRAGVMRFNVAALLGLSGNVLIQSNLSTQLAPAATYYEAAHNYLRFSEQMPWAPHGAQPTGIAATSGNGFVVTHCNQAWGPNGTVGNPHFFPPDGSSGYWTVTRFDGNGGYVWRADTDSILELGDGGYINDIPTGAGDDPSILAVMVDNQDNVYLGGRRTRADSSGVCAFRLDDTGTLVWSQDLGGTIREGAVAVNPQTQAPVFGGDVNTAWPDAGGVKAHLWELTVDAGLVARHFNVSTTDVSVLGVAIRSDGVVVYVTDKV